MDEDSPTAEGVVEVVDGEYPVGIPLAYVINHIFLPPKLPQDDDCSVQDEVGLTKLFHEALESFIALLPEDQQDDWVHLPWAFSMLLDNGKMGSPLRKLDQKFGRITEGGALVLHVTHQNAGLIIRRQNSDNFSFESFELSATAEAVTSTQGRLIRKFPGPAIGVPASRVLTQEFREAIMKCLISLESEAIPDSIEKIPKTSCNDSQHPRFVTEMLSGFLRGIGRPLDIPRVYKRTRDEVLWNGSGLGPWRRSPRWILLKVALQTSIANPHGYKVFMIYFLCFIMNLAVDHDKASPMLHIMLAKINRRIQKLQAVIPDDLQWELVQDHIDDSMEGARDFIAKKWKSYQKPTPMRLADLKKLKPQDDTILPLANLRPYLESMHNAVLQPRDNSTFTAGLTQRMNGLEIPDPALLKSGSHSEICLGLLDVEHWVSNSLRSWDQPKTSTSSAVALSRLTSWYIYTAAPIYAESPESFSTMILTTMLLWTALDKVTVSRFPLLKKYNVGFPTSLLDSLILPKRHQLTQLRDIEAYLDTRKSTALGYPSIFGDVTSPMSFGAQYVDSSPSHRELKIRIEKDAKEGLLLKEAEFKEAKSRYSSLLKESELLTCTTIQRMVGRGRNSGVQTFHDPQCPKCDLLDRAQTMKIGCHEWPLPADDAAAKAVVFELDIPRLLRHWRSTAYQILADVLNPLPPTLARGKAKLIALSEYEGLASYLKSPADRLSLASASKPYVMARKYNSQPVSEASKETVCLPNALGYTMLDSKSQRKATDYLGKFDIRECCTFVVQPGIYQTLQYALNDTKHTPNENVANQANCPTGLTVHELHAYTSIRSGHRVQWLNIARELVARTLDFGREEVCLLFLQASSQAGPPALRQVSRDTHIELEEKGFGLDLLSALEEGLTTVESNWQGSIAAFTFISLAARLLSLSLHEDVRCRSLKFLDRARGVTLKYLRVVGALLHKSDDPDETAYLTVRVLDLALIVHATFDIDPRLLPGLLLPADNLAIIVEAATIANDRWPVSEASLPILTRELLRRFSRTSRTLEDVVRKRIVANPDGIDKAVRRRWESYEAGTPWTVLAAPDDHWVSTRTTPSEDGSAMTVHFNILTGSLLIDNRPLARLPREYETHSTYQRLFGNKILEVVPSKDGLIFETKNSVYGHTIHFSLHGKELIVRSSQGHDVWEVIPIHALEGDFPRSFIHNYVHWVHRGSMVIEWRPLATRFLASGETSWFIGTPETPGASSLVFKDKSLVSSVSNTAEVIFEWLKPIESAININIDYNSTTKETEVQLPRFGLNFLLRKHGLESKQLKGMIVDTNQDIGTFHGLKNKLVLKNTRSPSRIVLVPHGDISYHVVDDHVHVSIATGTNDKIAYHQFVIDKDLGRLVDTGSMKSRIYRLYLHAVTSHCLPDALTSRTGCEEALYGLRLASTRSFMHLDADVIEQLKLLAKLTPAREYYSKGSRSVHTETWENLSPLSHHEDFVEEVRLMVEQAESFRPFQPAESKPGYKVEQRGYKVEHRGSLELRQRAAIRCAFYRVHPYGAERFSHASDAYYQARDSTIDNWREQEACSSSMLVDRWTQCLNPTTDIFHKAQKWGMIHGLQPDFQLNCGKLWLQNPDTFLGRHWVTLQSFMASSNSTQDKTKLAIFLANLAQSSHGNKPLIHALLACATVPALRAIQAPADTFFDMSKGYEPDKSRLRRKLEESIVPYELSPEQQLPRQTDESDRDLSERRRAAYLTTTKAQVGKSLETLMQQWPTPAKSLKFGRSANTDTYLTGLQHVKSDILRWWQQWHSNFELQNYFSSIQAALDSILPPLSTPEKFVIPAQEDAYQTRQAYLKLDDLLYNPAPELHPLDESKLQDLLEKSQLTVDAGSSSLKSLISRLSRKSVGLYQTNYVRDLKLSHSALLKQDLPRPRLSAAIHATTFKNHLEQCKANVESMYKKICSKMFIPSSPSHESARRASVFPRLSPSIILRLLAKFNHVRVSAEWRNVLTQFGLALCSMQRAQRLVNCGEQDLLNELLNKGHTNWNPMEHPDWLLFEIENNLVIRPEQSQIANEMIKPRTGTSSIMQLNMGLGKSSVIAPLVAATLADGSKLARVVCLDSLSEQMWQLLVNKLGSLLGRRIYRLPITRALAPTVATCLLIQQTYENCMATGGVLLVQPESLLSFELLGIDHFLSPQLNMSNADRRQENDVDSRAPGQSTYEVGKAMIQTQNWLDRNVRDILDESDEVLSVRFELIYTVGIQQNIEFSPNRWVITQFVLGTLAEVSTELVIELPLGLEVQEEASAGTFPRIRILQEAAGKALLQRVAQTICRSGMPSLAMWAFSEQEREIILEFITNSSISKFRASMLDTRVFRSNSTRMTLLLLRGLFAGGVLEWVFAKKRFRVNYGLDLSRSMLAVPYHAKDNPSARSEFSHPDTAIALTCLCYYYGGLSDSQINASFEELLLSDHAQEDYFKWIQHCAELPKQFKNLSGVNLRDRNQCCHELFPKLRWSKGLIDYYLQHLVFPKEMKEFTNKLSSSGWEIAREKTHPITGFSGTNDSKYMLPLSIKQSELPEQLATNAIVLETLLRPENTYDTEFTLDLETLDPSSLLDIALDLEVRVVLDVGAQVLESNEVIASLWLDRTSPEDAQAVIYIHDKEIFCLNRDGLKEPLNVSPFARQMDQCLVYLDEANCRGIDLKLPADYRAIVTLGPELTKDRLAQACKRLRKLGQGQSVVFVATREIQEKILQCSKKPNAASIEVEDVLLWSIVNSWEFTTKGMPLWATQGMRHYRRRGACNLTADVPIVPLGILEPEALTLEERYGLYCTNLDEVIVTRNRLRVDNDVSRGEVCAIRAKCREFGLVGFGESDLHEEQERELQPESEREQEIQAPPPAKPHEHHLHPNVARLVLTGQLTSHDGLIQAFHAFDSTRAKGNFVSTSWPASLLITKDFSRTVEIPDEENLDSFLRPVNWILSFQGQDNEPGYLIMSPFEVHELLPQLRGNNRVRLHVYSPRLSLANRSLESLSYCSTPPVPIGWSTPAISTVLNLFAGQLYVRDAAEYRKLCRFLGVRFTHPYSGVNVAADGFIAPQHRNVQDSQTATVCKFDQSPIDFLRMVIALRRCGQPFESSHMGKILSGELVRAIDFEVPDQVEEVDENAMDIDEKATVIKREPRRR